MAKKQSFYRKRYRTSYRWVASLPLIPVFAVAGITYTTFQLLEDEEKLALSAEEAADEADELEDKDSAAEKQNQAPNVVNYNKSNNSEKRTAQRRTTTSYQADDYESASVPQSYSDKSTAEFTNPGQGSNIAPETTFNAQPVINPFNTTANQQAQNTSAGRSLTPARGNFTGLKQARTPTPFQRSLASLGSLNASNLVKNPTALINSGVLDIKAGTTLGDSNGTFTQSKGKTTVNGSLLGDVAINGGSLQGSGTVGGNLTLNGGEFNPGNSPGTFTIKDTFTVGTDVTLNVEIALLPSDLTDIDPLNIIGNSLIDVVVADVFDVQGTVNFIIEDPLVALSDFNLGDFFKVANADGSLVGTDGTGFENATFTVTRPEVADNDPQDPQQNQDPAEPVTTPVSVDADGKLVEVPAPGTLLLMMSALLFWRPFAKRQA